MSGQSIAILSSSNDRLPSTTDTTSRLVCEERSDAAGRAEPTPSPLVEAPATEESRTTQATTAADPSPQGTAADPSPQGTAAADPSPQGTVADPSPQGTAADPSPQDPAAISEAKALDLSLLRDQIIEAVKQVFDPEIPVNIYELGLIYKLDVESSGRVVVEMTLTAPACPAAGELPGEVEGKILRVEGVTAVNLQLVWEPPWSPELMSEDARLALGFF